MQILYCDECGVRLEEGTIEGADKTFCPVCAPKHAHEMKPAVVVGRDSSRRRPSKTPSPSQAQRPSGSEIIRVSPPDRNTPPRPRTNVPNVAATGMSAESDEFDENAPAWKIWLANNKTTAVGAGVVVAVVISVVVWMLAGKGAPGKVSNLNTKKTPPEIKAPINGGGEKTVPPQPPVPPPDTVVAPPEPPKPPVEPFNPVMDMAKRRLEGVKANLASGKFKPFEVRRELEWFMGPQLKGTPMQIEAAEILEKLKEAKRPPDDASGAMPGVQAGMIFDKANEVFDTNFTPVETRTVKKINFNDTNALEKAFGRDTDLAIKFTGFIEIPKDGAYTFYVSSDDSSMLYIGDFRVVSNDGLHAMTERDGGMDLKAGKHAFTLNYFQGSGLAGLKLSWSGPGLIKELVPERALSSVPKK